ncbi:2-isopropylmalate synthase [Sphingomonas piscis]|uniref:2-isopropylmalate synthase n=1 Tax=Sphingomonas piscis TaxID=2714943 RepID=A0A6G7YNK5_9SPHN|nr:2-isopropylmalate synthase [Sphingomonas piscis]QIK78322.1 2-isopropylmalate synthase [Sphingomonas piscis]
MTDRIRIFDTTLRDGEQAPGFSMTVDAKLRMAKALAALQVDVIEAGFAAASPGDAQAVATVARNVEGPTIASLARAHEGDIRAAAEALKDAANKRIHVFIGTSPIHREFKLKLSREQVLEKIRTSVALAREFADDVEFSAEDAIRTERDYLAEALSIAAAAGATTLNVPDTVGYTTPDEIFDLFTFLGTAVDKGEDVIFSAHNHDDLGLAVANSLAAIRAGARQVECAVHGIGERAGNASLESLVMALRTRSDHYGVDTAIDATKIMAASRTLAQATNHQPARNKPIVGANAFAHEAGIHQHGILQNRATYEIMKPEDIGLSTDGIVMGKHSGRHALASRAKALGFPLEGEKLDKAFAEFKTVADEIGVVDTARLLALLEGLESRRSKRLWSLGKVDIRAPVNPTAYPVARVELEHGERGRITDLASAPGALDAAFTAVSQIMGIPARVDMLDMQYVAADPNDESEGEQGAAVLVEMAIEVDGELYTGRARARDILPCCVSAYIDAASNAEAVRRMRASAPAQAA